VAFAGILLLLRMCFSPGSGIQLQRQSVAISTAPKNKNGIAFRLFHIQSVQHLSSQIGSTTWLYKNAGKTDTNLANSM
jgi:hypothetical protein